MPHGLFFGFCVVALDSFASTWLCHSHGHRHSLIVALFEHTLACVLNMKSELSIEAVEKSSAPKKISKIQFGTFATGEIQKNSEFQVCSRELYKMPQRTPAPMGCLDPRLGISDKVSSCQTCQYVALYCSFCDVSNNL